MFEVHAHKFSQFLTLVYIYQFLYKLKSLYTINQ